MWLRLQFGLFKSEYLTEQLMPIHQSASLLPTKPSKTVRKQLVLKKNQAIHGIHHSLWCLQEFASTRPVLQHDRFGLFTALLWLCLLWVSWPSNCNHTPKQIKTYVEFRRPPVQASEVLLHTDHVKKLRNMFPIPRSYANTFALFVTVERQITTCWNVCEYSRLLHHYACCHQGCRNATAGWCLQTAGFHCPKDVHQQEGGGQFMTFVTSHIIIRL